MKLLDITVHNESFSYSFYVLAYQVEKRQYNLSVVTRIMPLNNTNLFTTMVNIDPRDDKAVPVADIVFFTNKTTLTDHYRLLGDVLNEIRKNDNTSWVWNKVRVELNELAKTVEEDLAEYNVEGQGWAIVLDDACTSTCDLILGMAGTGVCLALCSVTNIGALVCSVACSIAWGTASGIACSYWCTGNIDPCSAGCGGFCSGVCSGACNALLAKLGVPELSYFCEKYACVPACTGACEAVCG